MHTYKGFYFCWSYARAGVVSRAGAFRVTRACHDTYTRSILDNATRTGSISTTTAGVPSPRGLKSSTTKWEGKVRVYARAGVVNDFPVSMRARVRAYTCVPPRVVVEISSARMFAYARIRACARVCVPAQSLSISISVQRSVKRPRESRTWTCRSIRVRTYAESEGSVESCEGACSELRTWLRFEFGMILHV